MKKSQLLAILFACGATAATVAQNPPSSPIPVAQAPAARPTNGEPRPAFPPNRPPRSSFEDSLAPEVKEKYKAVRDEAAAKEKPFRDQLRKTRTDLDGLVRADKVDEDAIVKKALAIGQTEGELALIRARTNAKYRELLPAEQADKLINPYKMFSQGTNTPPGPGSAPKPAAPAPPQAK